MEHVASGGVEIVGNRADGNVIVCGGYVNPDNEWSRDSYRVAPPPFQQHLSEAALRSAGNQLPSSWR